MRNVTKHRTPEKGVYAVRLDGKPTRLTIRRDDSRRQWGEPTAWEVTEADPDWPEPGGRVLFTVHGLDDALTVLWRLANAFAAAGGSDV